MDASKGLTGADFRDMLAGRAPPGFARNQNPSPPSPFGGAGGLSGERPPLENLTDMEIDILAESEYNRRMGLFEAAVAADRRPPRRRGFSDYTTKNCEEAYHSA